MFEDLFTFTARYYGNLTAYFASGEITGASVSRRHTVIGVNIYIGIPTVHGSHHSNQIRPATCISRVRRCYRPLHQSTTYWASTCRSCEERNAYRTINTLSPTVNMGSDNILDIGHSHCVADPRTIIAQLDEVIARRIRIARWYFFRST